MSDIARWLMDGDLRSDGMANEVAERVLQDIRLLPSLMDGLASADAPTRGHAADALEKIARERPKEIAPYLGFLLKALGRDQVAMVRWHVAMILGYFSSDRTLVRRVAPALLRATRDRSVFCQSWAVTSLCLIARQHPEWIGRIAQAISPLLRSSSSALRSRSRRALALITDASVPLPSGWVKARHLRHLGDGA
jgi:vesicle coat complex subunit